MMNEAFLHYIWKLRYFKKYDFTTTSGEPVQIIKQGEHNTDAGPDFFNARIKIGDTIWAGNVEIHIKSSDWNKHQHSGNSAYDNIVLHVVYENDVAIARDSGEIIPVLELKNYIDLNLWNNYLNLRQSNQQVPCNHQIKHVDPITVNLWLDRLLVERLEHKTRLLENSLKLNLNDWEETFYQALARNYGFKVNAVPFELLAKSLPLRYLQKHKQSLVQVEALLFGQAGFLDEVFDEEYPTLLKREYEVLKPKFGLQSMDKQLWKFMRLRPINFPTVRIAQFAGLIHSTSGLVSNLLAGHSLASLKSFLTAQTSEYWHLHFRFSEASPYQLKSIGADSINNIIINSVAPFLFLYGKMKGKENYKQLALDLLENTAPEKNHIISMWNELGIQPSTAYQTQGLIQLKNAYCIQKKCLNCTIGSKIIQS